MSRRVSAAQALEIMQALPSDFCNGESLENEEYEAVNAAKAMAELEAESSDFKDEETAAVLPRLFESEKNMGQSHDKNQPVDSTDAYASQSIRSKNESF